MPWTGILSDAQERGCADDFDQLIIAHGNCIKKAAKPFVERAFRWLLH